MTGDRTIILDLAVETSVRADNLPQRAQRRRVYEDTQFLNFAIGLPDLWIEPTLAYELDLERDHGTYLNLGLGHTFTLVGPREECADDILDFRLSAAQSWGDTRRIEGYLLDVDHAGLMDACIKGELAWTTTKGVTLGAYVAYIDFLFDSDVRSASRLYEATGSWENSWNFVSGLSLAVVF